MPGFGSIGSYPLAAPEDVHRALATVPVVLPYVNDTVGAPIGPPHGVQIPAPRRRLTGVGTFPIAGPRLVGHGGITISGDGALMIVGPTLAGIGTLRLLGLGAAVMAGIDLAGIGAIAHVQRQTAGPGRRVLAGTGVVTLAPPALTGAGAVIRRPDAVDAAWTAHQRAIAEDDVLLVLLGVLQ